MNIPGKPGYYVLGWIVAFLLYAIASTQDFHDAELIRAAGPDPEHQLSICVEARP